MTMPLDDVSVITVQVPDSSTVVTVQVPGVQGPPGVFKLGTVTTGAPGSDASATTTSDPSNPNIQVVNLTIPRGNVGAQGIQGIQGVQGVTGATGPANTLAIGTITTLAAGSQATATITGTSPNQTLNLSLPAGATGPTGPQGAPNTLTIGTVTTLAAGSPASATITGSAPNQTLNLSLPQGTPGASGVATNGMPQGGAAGTLLAKNTATDFDTVWLAPASAATTNAIMKRDANGRAQVVDPSVSADIATKNYVDTQDATTLASAKSYADTGDALAEKKANKNVASGYAGLDATSGLLIPAYEDVVEVTQPANPAVGHQRRWMDSTAHRMKTIDSSGNIKFVSSYLGSGTAFPASPVAGDTFLRTDVGTNGTVYYYSGNAASGSSGWFVDGNAIFCTSTTVPTAGIYAGVNTWTTDTKVMWVYSGTAWVAYQGLLADTGWTALTLNSPTTNAGGGSFYRRVGNTVHLRVETNFNGGYSSNYVFTNLPAGSRPFRDHYFQAVAYGGGTASVFVTTGGDVAMATTGTYSGIIISTVFLTA